jgi:hypothetical protein
MDFAYKHFQDHINLLKKRKLKLLHTAANFRRQVWECFGSICPESPDGRNACLARNGSRGLKAEGFYWETNRENLTV